MIKPYNQNKSLPHLISRNNSSYKTKNLMELKKFINFLMTLTVLSTKGNKLKLSNAWELYCLLKNKKSQRLN